MCGGCSSGKDLAVLVKAAQAKEPSRIVLLTRDLRRLHSLSLEEEVPLPPPVWLQFLPSEKSWLCAHRGFLLNGAVGESVLLQYCARTGKRLQTVGNVAGVAFSQSAGVYVSGRVDAPQGMVRVSPPEGFDPQRWLLVGVDAKRRLYWCSVERAGRWTVTSLACADSGGQVLWQSPLTGAEGILASVDRHAQVCLGWGCEWLEVSPEGHILVFAWSGSEKVRGGVGVYRVMATS